MLRGFRLVAHIAGALEYIGLVEKNPGGKGGKLRMANNLCPCGAPHSGRSSAFSEVPKHSGYSRSELAVGLLVLTVPLLLPTASTLACKAPRAGRLCAVPHKSPSGLSAVILALFSALLLFWLMAQGPCKSE